MSAEPTKELPLILSVKRTAAELDVSEDWVRGAVARGDLDRVQLGPRKVGITGHSVHRLAKRGARR